MATKTIAPIHETTKLGFEIMRDEVAFFLKPTYRARIMGILAKLVMHPATCLTYMGAGPDLVHDAYLRPQWRMNPQLIAGLKL